VSRRYDEGWALAQAQARFHRAVSRGLQVARTELNRNPASPSKHSGQRCDTPRYLPRTRDGLRPPPYPATSPGRTRTADRPCIAGGGSADRASARGRAPRPETSGSGRGSQTSERRSDIGSGMTDAGEFEAFVRSYQDMVYAVALRLLGSPAEAEDIAQTVFLKAFQRFDQLAASDTAAGWLKTVTRNACLNHLSRHRSRWKLFSELSAPGDGGDFGTDLAAGESIARDLETADEHHRLERALRGLPDHQRVPLVLFHFDDLSYQAIADMLGVSLGKVKTDIHRGRDALRRQLTAAHATR